ncbi:MAG: ABC transporter substrate-binding protein [Acidimicrobiales bacterium]
MGSSKKTRAAALGMVLLVATAAVACSSTNSAGKTASGSGIPASANSDHTGITATTVNVANVNWATIFKGAGVGAEAYAAYVNSTGGINGRKIVVGTGDDGDSGATNKQLTQNAITNDFALVGSFSLQDGFGGALLAKNPGMPNVSVVLDPTTNKLPNTYSPVPLNDGWEEGPLQYFKHRFPHDLSVGTLVGDMPSAESAWAGEKYVLEKVGYKVVYDQTYAPTQTDFTQNVIAMKNAGVNILFVDQLPVQYAPSLLKALNEQDFHPVVVLGAATYSNDLVPDSGGPVNVNGDFLDQNYSLYLGTDASAIPAVGTFLKWVDTVSPGFKADLFTMYVWISAQLFAQALHNAGTNPSRGSLLTALSKITSFDADHLIAANNPAAKTSGNCYLLGQVVNGQFQRLDDPPVSSSTNGYRCDYSYVTPPPGA